MLSVWMEGMKKTYMNLSFSQKLWGGNLRRRLAQIPNGFLQAVSKRLDVFSGLTVKIVDEPTDIRKAYPVKSGDFVCIFREL